MNFQSLSISRTSPRNLKHCPEPEPKILKLDSARDSTLNPKTRLAQGGPDWRNPKVSGCADQVEIALTLKASLPKRPKYGANRAKFSFQAAQAPHFRI